MTARYQVRPRSIDQCKQAIKNLVEYIQSQWGDGLGDHGQILDEEGGLHKLAALLRSGELEIPNN